MLSLVVNMVATWPSQDPRLTFAALVESERVINISVGMMMERSDVTEDEARVLLSESGRRTGSKGSDVAKQYIETGML